MRGHIDPASNPAVGAIAETDAANFANKYPVYRPDISVEPRKVLQALSAHRVYRRALRCGQ